METKTCGTCNIEKPIKEFSRKLKGYQSRCKECFNLYTKEHYQNNKEAYKEKANKNNNEYRLRNLQYMVDHFKSHPCVDCGETDPVVLEFDHVRDKKIAVSKLHHSSFRALVEEMDKCEVRCANCHRRKTAKQFDYYKGIRL